MGFPRIISKNNKIYTKLGEFCLSGDGQQFLIVCHTCQEELQTQDKFWKHIQDEHNFMHGIKQVSWYFLLFFVRNEFLCGVVKLFGKSTGPRRCVVLLVVYGKRAGGSKGYAVANQLKNKKTHTAAMTIGMRRGK